MRSYTEKRRKQYVKKNLKLLRYQRVLFSYQKARSRMFYDFLLFVNLSESIYILRMDILSEI